MKILMVCKGNICRSPLAEGILKDLSNKKRLDWEIDSAAIKAYHIGKFPDSRAIYTAKLQNIDISKHVCRLLSMEDFDTFDIIYAMSVDVLDFMLKMVPKEYHNKLRLLLKEVDLNTDQDVPDPYYGEQKDFDLAYTLIFSACQNIVKKYYIL